jgi:hypothetical protein
MFFILFFKKIYTARETPVAVDIQNGGSIFKLGKTKNCTTTLMGSGFCCYYVHFSHSSLCLLNLVLLGHP